jgi:hypothetical protein
MHQVIVRLTDQEYAILMAEAAKSGKQPEMLLHELIRRLQKSSQKKTFGAGKALAERLYREGKVLNLPTRKPLTSEEMAERERLAQVFAGGKPASEMVIEDRGPF